jgi:hypothetical protein
MYVWSWSSYSAAIIPSTNSPTGIFSISGDSGSLSGTENNGVSTTPG